MLHCSRALAGAVLTASAVIVLGVPALAAPPRERATTTTTTSSTTSTSTAPTTTTSTTAPKATVPPTTTTSVVPEPTTTTTTEPPPLEPGQVPPDVQAMIDAYPRTPARSTADLMDALAPLGAYDLSPAQLAPAFGRFPVAGRASYSHDWLFPRHVPEFHVHEGTDVFAERGTPVLAPTAGTVRTSNGSIGGLAVRVTQPDGTFWYLSHLDAIADGIEDGVQVAAGQVVGTVGDSGNAKGGAPHVHVEVHPHGGEALDPKPLLDQYLDEALARAPEVVLRLIAEHAPPPRPSRIDVLPKQPMQDLGRPPAPAAVPGLSLFDLL